MSANKLLVHSPHRHSLYRWHVSPKLVISKGVELCWLLTLTTGRPIAFSTGRDGIFLELQLRTSVKIQVKCLGSIEGLLANESQAEHNVIFFYCAENATKHYLSYYTVVGCDAYTGTSASNQTKMKKYKWFSYRARHWGRSMATRGLHGFDTSTTKAFVRGFASCFI